MRKLLNTLLHGDQKTKLYLWSLVLLMLSAVGCTVMFIITISLGWVIGILLSLVIAFFVGRSQVLQDSGMYENEDSELRKKSPTNEKPQITDNTVLKKSKPDEDTDDTEERAVDDQYLENYSKKQLKQIMVAYKVKKIHYPILIDYCQSRHVKQCPAYLWVNWNKVHFLLLEEKPRTFVLDISECHRISYIKGVPASPEEEYVGVQKGKLISHVFGALVPTYYEEVVNRKTISKKNLYIICDDIWITNFSAKAAFELLLAGFDLPEQYQLSSGLSAYVKEAYKQKILWQDRVLTTEEYKAKIRNILQGMVDAKISYFEFRDNLEAMVSRQLITKEYADYYEALRKKNQ